MTNYWLVKQEPSGPRGYNFSTLQKEKTTVWDGVHNNLALKHMRNMKKGDSVLYYHTADERQAVGIMTVTSEPYPNPNEDNERFIVVDVKFKKRLKKSVSCLRHIFQAEIINTTLLPIYKNFKTFAKLSTLSY